MLVLPAASFPCDDDDNNCDQYCSMASGSPLCSCETGYLLGEDEKTCDGEVSSSVATIYVPQHL